MQMKQKQINTVGIIGVIQNVFPSVELGVRLPRQVKKDKPDRNL